MIIIIIKYQIKRISRAPIYRTRWERRALYNNTNYNNNREFIQHFRRQSALLKEKYATLKYPYSTEKETKHTKINKHFHTKYGKIHAYT